MPEISKGDADLIEAVTSAVFVALVERGYTLPEVVRNSIRADVVKAWATAPAQAQAQARGRGK